MKGLNQKSSDARRLFFGLTLLSRISKALSGKTPDQATDLRAGKQADIAQLVGSRFGRIPSRPRRCGAAIEKNIEVRIARRFKRLGHRRTRTRAEHLAQLLWLRSPIIGWTRWWQKTASVTRKVRLCSMRLCHQVTIDRPSRSYSLVFP